MNGRPLAGDKGAAATMEVKRPIRARASMECMIVPWLGILSKGLL